MAFDVCFLVNKKASYNGNWGLVALIGKNIGLDAGYYWKSFKDKPHFQYTGGYTLQDFQNKKVDLTKFN